MFVSVFVLFCFFNHGTIGSFLDDDVTHVEGDVNPVRDLEIISNELRLKDLQYLDKQIVSARH